MSNFYGKFCGNKLKAVPEFVDVIEKYILQKILLNIYIRTRIFSLLHIRVCLLLIPFSPESTLSSTIYQLIRQFSQNCGELSQSIFREFDNSSASNNDNRKFRQFAVS